MSRGASGTFDCSGVNLLSGGEVCKAYNKLDDSLHSTACNDITSDGRLTSSLYNCMINCS